MSRRCVILTGMMGSGKTEVGELLGEQLGYEFIDTDVVIRQRAGKSINKIFREDGEDAFRTLEREVIAELADAKEKVIATGGGAVMDADNRRLLKAMGQVVYLKASPRELYLRMKNDKSRPLLQVENPQKELDRILGERKAVYEQADIVIDTESVSVDEVVDQLIDELARRTIETQME